MFSKLNYIGLLFLTVIFSETICISYTDYNYYYYFSHYKYSVCLTNCFSMATCLHKNLEHFSADIDHVAEYNEPGLQSNYCNCRADPGTKT